MPKKIDIPAITAVIPRITSATPDASNYTVNITWDNGTETTFDLSELVAAKKGVFKRFQNPDNFLRLRVDEYGNYITWPYRKDQKGRSIRDIDMGNLGFWLLVHPEIAPKEPRHPVGECERTAT